MQALVFKETTITYVTNYPQPVAAPGEALIRVTVAGICATDREITRGYLDFHGVLGHEFTGVVETAADARWVGRRVVGDINCGCGDCAVCRRGSGKHCPHRTTLGISGRDGAMAGYCVLPETNLLEVPEVVSDRQAVFTEPLAAALEILEQVHIRPSDRVVVVGDGKLGLLTAQVLALTGCGLTVVGRHPENWSVLTGMGIPAALEQALPAGLLADVVVDCSGQEAGFALAQTLLRPRGRLVLKSTFHGMPRINLTSLVVAEMTVIGSRCGPFAPALALLARGLIQVEPLISQTYPLSRGVEGLQQAQKPGILKILLEP